MSITRLETVKLTDMFGLQAEIIGDMSDQSRPVEVLLTDTKDGRSFRLSEAFLFEVWHTAQAMVKRQKGEST